VILDRAPFPPLKRAGLSLRMMPSLNRVSHVVVVADLVAHGQTTRGKLIPSLLPGLGALVHGWSELLSEVPSLSPPVNGACKSERSPLTVAIVLDGLEGVAQHQEARPSARYMRVMQRRCLALCSHSLVFESGMSEMSSRWQAAAACWEPPCRLHRRW
jgi:hypothetical protein